MATVSLGLPEIQEEPQNPRIEKYSSPDNRIKIYFNSGEYEVWVDGLLMYGHISEIAAKSHYKRLTNPPVEEIKIEVKTTPIVEESSITTTHKCPNCGIDVSDERTQLVGVLTCMTCTPQPAKLLGVLDFSHKTGGVLMMTDDPKLFKLLKKPINQQR